MDNEFDFMVTAYDAEFISARRYYASFTVRGSDFENYLNKTACILEMARKALAISYSDSFSFQDVTIEDIEYFSPLGVFRLSDCIVYSKEVDYERWSA